MLKWNGNIAIGKDRNNKYTIYDIRENGDLWLTGDNWGHKLDKKGFVKYPNRACKIGSIEKSRQIAERLNQLENTK